LTSMLLLLLTPYNCALIVAVYTFLQKFDLIYVRCQNMA